jgi:rhodanese-related sulfurtransferase
MGKVIIRRHRSTLKAMTRLIEFSLQHPLLVSATLAAVIALLVYEIRLRSHSRVAVPAHAAVQLINQGATVVDLREPARFGSGHIVDALNIAPDQLAEKAETRLKKKRPVLLVCDNGSQSGRLVGDLRKAGYDNAWSLDGGLAAWQRDNLPVVSDRGKT